MKIYSLLTALILFNIGFYGCIEESAESTDNSKEPICSTSSYTSSCQFRYLEEIQGKTLSFKYKLGSKSYVDDIKLDNEPRYYNDINIKAFLDGTIIYEGNTRKVLCWYAEGAMSKVRLDHDYMCHWDMGSSKNTYMFNINGSKITGQYDYTRDGSNYIANVIENPDATFFSSSNIRGLLTNNKENRNNTIESKENQLRKNNIYDSFYKEIEMLKTHNKNQIN